MDHLSKLRHNSLLPTQPSESNRRLQTSIIPNATSTATKTNTPTHYSRSQLLSAARGATSPTRLQSRPIFPNDEVTNFGRWSSSVRGINPEHWNTIERGVSSNIPHLVSHAHAYTAATLSTHMHSLHLPITQLALLLNLTHFLHTHHHKHASHFSHETPTLHHSCTQYRNAYTHWYTFLNTIELPHPTTPITSAPHTISQQLKTPSAHSSYKLTSHNHKMSTICLNPNTYTSTNPHTYTAHHCSTTGGKSHFLLLLTVFENTSLFMILIYLHLLHKPDHIYTQQPCYSNTAAPTKAHLLLAASILGPFRTC